LTHVRPVSGASIALTARSPRTHIRSLNTDEQAPLDSTRTAARSAMASRCRTAVGRSPTFLGRSGTGDAPGVGPVAPELVMILIITVNVRATKGVDP
jgi:hypothetical protein